MPRAGRCHPFRVFGKGKVAAVWDERVLPPPSGHWFFLVAFERAVDILSARLDLMPDETGHLPDGPGGDAQGALESAARHLRASPPPAGGSPARQREILRGRQERDLLAWAREQRRLIESATYLGLAERGGEEHRLWLAEEGQRYFKATFPGRCGFAVILTHAGVPDLADATPLEYLERLILQNRVFGDKVRLEGITQEPGGTAIVTSQPHLWGCQAVLGGSTLDYTTASTNDHGRTYERA